MFLKLQTKNNIYKKTSNIGTPTNQLNVPSIHPSIQPFILIRKDDQPAIIIIMFILTEYNFNVFFFKILNMFQMKTFILIFFFNIILYSQQLFWTEYASKTKTKLIFFQCLYDQAFQNYKKRTLFTLTHQDIFNDRTFV